VRAATVLGSLAEHETELEQVLGLLRAAGVDAPETLSLGAGDRRLLALHRALTGGDVELTVACGRCGEVNELTVASGALPELEPRVAPCGAGGGVREPTYADLAGLPESPEDAVDELLRRCTVGTPSRAPRAADLEAVDDSLAGPLVSACAECGSRIEAPLDLERVVLELLQRRLGRIDHEVHLLASAYHWSLDAIQRLPDDRRARYARLVAEAS
jgi:hypothetical protein